MSTVVAVAIAGLVSVAATACSGPSSSSMPSAAPRASDPACARALAGLPSTVLGKPRTPSDVAGTASWGEPPIVLRCGLPEPAPTTKSCLTVNGVDWIVDDSGDPIVFTTYGRAPAAEVRVPTAYGRENAPSVLVGLGPAAATLPKTSHACIGG